MLARDLATAKDRPLLKDLVILVFAPNFNAGRQREDRPEQPPEPERPGRRRRHPGQRARASTSTATSSSSKAPRSAALVRLLNAGTRPSSSTATRPTARYHRYTLTYDGPRHPTADAALVETIRDKLLPEVGRGSNRATGFKSYLYGNFSRDRTRWETVRHTPRLRHAVRRPARTASASCRSRTPTPRSRTA